MKLVHASIGFLQISAFVPATTHAFLTRPSSSSPTWNFCSVVGLARSTARPPLLATPVSDNVNESIRNISDDVEDTSAENRTVSRILQTPIGELSDEDALSLRNLLSATADQGDPEKAQKVLFRMVDEYYTTENKARKKVLQPTGDDFYIALHAWQELGNPETSRKVGAIFHEQEEFYQKTGLCQPDARVVQTVLRILSSSRERGVDRRIWSLFERAQEEYRLSADADMYASVIRSLARSRERDSAERAERVLREAVDKFPPGIDKQGNPTGITVDSFNVVLTAWAKSGFENGPKRAEELLVYMNEVHTQHGENVLTPNVHSFTSLIDAYAQTNEWEGVGQGEQILNRLLDQFLEGEEELEPNVASWTIVISAWNRLARKNKRGAAKRADRLLRRMEELFQEGRTTVQPDAITYNTVINAWASARTREGMERAEELLHDMNERYLDGENEMRPTTKSLRAIVDAWVRMDEPDVVERAEALLDRYEDQMEEFEKEDEAARDIYKSMLFGWSKYGDPRKAEDYLNGMISMGMKPDSFCFDRIIESYTNLNAPDSFKRSCSMFELMDQCSKTGDLKPNERVYTSFIRAMTKARVQGLAKKASLVLKRMNDMSLEGNKGIQPTTFTLNAVLHACAESALDKDTDSSEAFKVAVGVYNSLRTGYECEPDHVSFGNMLRCSALLPEGPERDSMIASTFQQCCQKGLVNSYVLRDLQETASEEQWRSLLQCPQGELDADRLPASWSDGFERRRADEQSDDKRQAGRRPTRGRPGGRQY